ncbi:hypothetical protein M9H77_18776 [Catharanthus roseus]|uniref:Uncharacterized protein n=1 Tax=Catharanthus roseus TaxID=4058 RepID=A0ACC0B8K6_CATRO|nr:hypothetical protein M9H77_18776 [Catharanthus roseus]
MDMENLSNSSSSIPSSKPKTLIFDRRYGWVIDVWKDPSEEALSGGRGMFCIVPLAKSLIKAASQTINTAASSTLKVVENPNLFAPEVLRANMNDQLKRITSSMNKPEFDLAVLKRRWTLSPNPNEERNELH